MSWFQVSPFDNSVTLIYFLTVSLLLCPFSLWRSRTASSCWPRCGTTAFRAGGDDTGRSNWSPASSSDSCFLSSHWYVGGRREEEGETIEVKEEKKEWGAKILGRGRKEEGRDRGKFRESEAGWKRGKELRKKQERSWGRNEWEFENRERKERKKARKEWKEN